MASALTHAFAAVAVAKTCYRQGASWRFWLLAIASAVVPDADVIGFYLGIQYGDMRAKDWKPHKMTDEELLEAIYLKKMLKAIAGSAGRRLAIINGRPFETGEQAKVKVGQKMVTVRCLEVNEKSAVVLIEGISQPKEISLP